MNKIYICIEGPEEIIEDDWKYLDEKENDDYQEIPYEWIGRPAGSVTDKWFNFVYHVK